MIYVTPQISLDENEIQLDFVRASGPGGQNVNKVATAVKLSFNVQASPNLPEDVKARLMRLAGNRLTQEGILLLDARKFRSQERNRQDAIERLTELIRQAAVRPRTRYKTKPTLASREKRLTQKKCQTRNKTLRKKVSSHDD